MKLLDELRQAHEALRKARAEHGSLSPRVRRANERVDALRGWLLVQELPVYAPAEGSALHRLVVPGSGVVGTPLPSGEILVDYEGNLHRTLNIQTFADRVMVAAGRHVTLAATSARAAASPDDLIQIGTWDPGHGAVRVEDAAALARWLKLDALPEFEMLTTGGVGKRRRDIKQWIALLPTLDPAVQAWVTQEAQRLGIPVHRANALRARSGG